MMMELPSSGILAQDDDHESRRRDSSASGTGHGSGSAQDGIIADDPDPDAIGAKKRRSQDSELGQQGHHGQTWTRSWTRSWTTWPRTTTTTTEPGIHPGLQRDHGLGLRGPGRGRAQRTQRGNHIQVVELEKLISMLFIF